MNCHAGDFEAAFVRYPFNLLSIVSEQGVRRDHITGGRSYLVYKADLYECLSFTLVVNRYTMVD